MGGKTATLLSSHVNDIFIGESSVFLPSREEIHAHLHSKLKEGFVSVAAFQPWTFSFSLVFGELSFLASKAKRVEKETRYGGGPCTLHNCTQNLKTGFPTMDVILPLVFGESSVFLPARERE